MKFDKRHALSVLLISYFIALLVIAFLIRFNLEK